ncbi:aminoglycoside N(3)-acetyltransferase [Campylobacter upsaliensis]|nr:aminoglycoside N(3)-acetyltransferase [Campylobacter upsaliensis]
MNFLQAKNKIYNKNDFYEALKCVGLERGDCICVHTELFNLGIALVGREDFLHILLCVFREILGKNGTLIMPTFTYDFCKGRNFDKKKNKSTMGVLTEFFRLQEGVLRSDDPIYSFAIWGADKGDFLKPTPTCFSENCVYDILAKKNGKIVLLGTDIVGYTFTHFIEERARVSYRYYKEFSGKIIDERGLVREKSIQFYVRDLKQEKSIFSVPKQVDILKANHNFRRESFANACIVSIKAKAYLKDTLSVLTQDEKALL